MSQRYQVAKSEEDWQIEYKPRGVANVSGQPYEKMFARSDEGVSLAPSFDPN